MGQTRDPWIKREIAQALRQAERRHVETVAGALSIVAQLINVLDAKGIVSRADFVMVMKNKIGSLTPAERGSRINLALIGLTAMLDQGTVPTKPASETIH